MSESEKEKALSVLMDEKAYKKYKAARDLDIPTATYIDIITAVGAAGGEDKQGSGISILVSPSGNLRPKILNVACPGLRRKHIWKISMVVVRKSRRLTPPATFFTVSILCHSLCTIHASLMSCCAKRIITQRVRKNPVTSSITGHFRT